VESAIRETTLNVMESFEDLWVAFFCTSYVPDWYVDPVWDKDATGEIERVG
jgi:hypothetical protein